jgi:hypothetical protein
MVQACSGGSTIVVAYRGPLAAGPPSAIMMEIAAMPLVSAR